MNSTPREVSDNLKYDYRTRTAMAWILYEEEIDVVSYAMTHDCSVSEAIETLYVDRIKRIGGQQ